LKAERDGGEVRVEQNFAEFENRIVAGNKQVRDGLSERTVYFFFVLWSEKQFKERLFFKKFNKFVLTRSIARNGP
jgi:hypothetical protein